jgi:polyisoprenoid-binding protein YceI
MRRNTMKRIRLLMFLLMATLILISQVAKAEDYVIDTKKSHAFIQFKISHLGFSWLMGRFNRFEGTFSYDEKDPSASKVNITIDTASVDTNFAERDKHLRGKDFLDVKKFPKATFVSTSVETKGKDKAVLKGDFTLHGVTRQIEIKVEQVGVGNDPWGGFRRGFEGRTKFALHDFDINFNLGPASKEVELYLSIEGIRK